MNYLYAAPLPGLLEKYLNLAIPHFRCTYIIYKIVSQSLLLFRCLLNIGLLQLNKDLRLPFQLFVLDI